MKIPILERWGQKPWNQSGDGKKMVLERRNMQLDQIAPGTEVFRKTDHGYQKVKLLVKYKFPAVRVRTLDKAAHEWLVKPEEILTVSQKLELDQIDYVNREAHVPILDAWKSGIGNRIVIALKTNTPYERVRKVIKLALAHHLITK
jgi:hypothetical protein